MKEIRSIIKAYEQTDFTKEKIALAAVVGVEASSYRRIGARMLVNSNGTWTGGISGGCLEGDALKRAQKAIFSGEPSRVVYDTMEEDSNQIGIGLGCNGRIEVLFSPIDPKDEENEIELLKKLLRAEQPSILIKVIDAPASLRLLGHKLLVENFHEPVHFAGINPIALAKFITTTREKKQSLTFDYQTVHGDSLRLLVEFIRPEIRLIIVGDNYDVSAMLGISEQLGWEVFVVGKAKKLPKPAFQQAKKVLDFSQINQISLHDYTAVLLMSHDYNRDKAMLAEILAKNPPYLGILGPKKRFLKMQNEMPEVDFRGIDFLYSPTGLEIGAETPSEIALSIAAEILAVFRGKKGRFLREKQGTIHEK